MSGPEDLSERGLAIFDQMIKTLEPKSGNFEAFRRMAEQTAPYHRELHESFQKIGEEAGICVARSAPARSYPFDDEGTNVPVYLLI